MLKPLGFLGLMLTIPAAQADIGAGAPSAIVQFVPFRQFENAPLPALAAEVLREVPDQFLYYMRLNNISPPVRQQ